MQYPARAGINGMADCYIETKNACPDVGQAFGISVL
jgi:hypothetical protein